MPPGDWASYFWPGSTVLRNKLDIHDRDELQALEYPYIAGRQGELQMATVSIPQTLDAEHLRNIHRHLFQDVYDWAGQYRTVPLAKDTHEFAPPNRIGSYLDGAASIAANTSWASVSGGEFAEAMAKVYAWANHAHPFREGNGRATKIWLADIAAQSPWRLDFERIDADVWNQAASLSAPDRGGLTPVSDTLIPVFAAMTETRPTTEPAAIRGSFAERMLAIGRQYDEPSPAYEEPRRNVLGPNYHHVEEAGGPADEGPRITDQQQQGYRL